MGAQNALRNNLPADIDAMSAVDAAHLLKECIKLTDPQGILPKPFKTLLLAIAKGCEHDCDRDGITVAAGVVLLLPPRQVIHMLQKQGF